MKRFLRTIDSVSEWSGSATRWLCVALVVVLTYEVIMRYFFNSPTEWAHVTSVMLFGSIAFLALAYTHLHRGHIRIDVFYEHFPPKIQKTLDIIFTIFGSLPLIASYIAVSFYWARRAWVDHEIMTQSYWYPPATPFRVVVFIGWSLFGLQILAQFIRDSYFLIKGKTYD